MERQNKAVEALNKKAWIIPLMFVPMRAFLADAKAVIEILDSFNGNHGFSIGAETLKKYEDQAPDEICKSMLGERKAFMGDNDPFGDIAMVCVE